MAPLESGIAASAAPPPTAPTTAPTSNHRARTNVNRRIAHSSHQEAAAHLGTGSADNLTGHDYSQVLGRATALREGAASAVARPSVACRMRCSNESRRVGSDHDDPASLGLGAEVADIARDPAGAT